MSKQAIRLLKDRRVIGGALALLAVVAVVNVVAMLSGGEEVPDVVVDISNPELEPPSDLQRVALDSAKYRETGQGLTTAELAKPPAVNRNPFLYATTSAPRKTKSTKPTQSAKPNDLACSAIFLGDGDPAALVNGRVVSVGDRVSRYRVESITEKGVTLRAGGRNKFVPLTTKRSGGAVGAPVALGQ